MQIETYEIEEISGEMGNLAADSESIELIKKLGLEGQTSLVENSTETRFPYPLMTKEEYFVYSQLMIQKVEISKYRAGIIPLRVLQVIAFCKDMPQISKLEIWHSASAKEDPLLVGIAKDPFTRQDIFYLIAKWGEVLLPFEKLREMALIKYKAKIKAQLELVVAKCKGYLENIDSIANKDMEEGSIDIPSFWYNP